MESSSPPASPSNGTLFTAAESESVIKYLVGLPHTDNDEIFTKSL